MRLQEKKGGAVMQAPSRTVRVLEKVKTRPILHQHGIMFCFIEIVVGEFERSKLPK